MYLSVQFDLPTGATIVCTFGIVLAAMAVVRPLVIRTRVGSIVTSGAGLSGPR
jgi:hypothetical protein